MKISNLAKKSLSPPQEETAVEKNINMSVIGVEAITSPQKIEAVEKNINTNVIGMEAISSPQKFEAVIAPINTNVIGMEAITSPQKFETATIPINTGMKVIASPQIFEVVTIPGRAGKSAYDIWLDEGNKGTKGDFLDRLTKSALIYKGSVDTFADLPATGDEVGDFWNIKDTGFNFVWDGLEWDQISGLTNLDNYVDRTTDQSISGRKTFTGRVLLNEIYSNEAAPKALLRTYGSITSLGDGNKQIHINTNHNGLKINNQKITGVLPGTDNLDVVNIEQYTTELSKVYGGKNLAMPDLTGKEYLGNGEYRLYGDNQNYFNYNVITGIYTLNGELNINYGNTFYKDLNLEQFVYSFYYDSGTFIGNNMNFNYYNSSIEGKTGITDVGYVNKSVVRTDLKLIYFIFINRTFDNYKFKLQIEEGITATPYTLPMYVTPEWLDSKIERDIMIGRVNVYTESKPFSGFRTIDDVTLQTGDTILVVGNGQENGIYKVNGNGVWQRIQKVEAFQVVSIDSGTIYGGSMQKKMEDGTTLQVKNPERSAWRVLF